MKTVWSKKFVGLLTVGACVGLGVMFLVGAFGQGRSSSGSAIDATQKQRVEQLYAEDADAWSRHDIAKIVSFFDPTYVYVAPDGKRTSYAEWRKKLPSDLAQVRNGMVKTTVKTVQVVDNGFVASIEMQYSYDFYDAKRSAWIPMTSIATQEETWRADGRGNWKIVLTKCFHQEAFERGSQPAQTGARKPSPASPVVAQSGGYQLTEEMIGQAIYFDQFLAGFDQFHAGQQFSASDIAAIRQGLIATFQKQPAREVAGYYKALAQLVPGLRSTSRSLTIATVREAAWESYAKDPTVFREFQNDPAGRIILKYNPVVVNAGEMIITRLNVNSLVASNALIATIAGVAPSTQAGVDETVRDLPSGFASLTKEQQEFYRQAESRLARFQELYADSLMRPAVVSDIKNAVHSPKDVPNMARSEENTAFKYEALLNHIDASLNRLIGIWNEGYPKAFAAHTIMMKGASWDK